ncbi:MAG: hypothetical protein WBQ18_00825 [Solirubrobacteraceae bacterium]
MALTCAGLAGLALTPAGVASTSRSTPRAAPGTSSGPLGTITEFALSTPDREPQAIAAAEDGTLWFTESATSSLGSATPSGVVTEIPGLSAPAADVTTAADGSIWATEPGGGYVARLSPDHALSQFLVGAATKPTGIGAGPDGNVWFPEQGGTAAIGRITPGGSITTFSAGLNSASKPDAIAAGPDGNLWFTDQGAHPAIGRITPAGVITEFSAGLPGDAKLTAIAGGPDGSLWFTDQGGHPAVGRVTPAGVITEFSTGLRGDAKLTAIAAGPDGNLWFTDQGGPSYVGQSTTAGTITEQATPTAGSHPAGIVAAPDGTIWLTEQGAHGQLAQVTLPAAGAAPGAAPPAASAPQATTMPVRSVMSTTATLAGMIDPGDVATSYHFEWGQTTDYGRRVPAADTSISATNGRRVVSEALTGLLPDTVYHYRLVVTDCGGCQQGTSNGADATFTTKSLTSSQTASGQPASGQPAAGQPAEPPAIGRSVVAGLVSGSVLIRAPKARRPHVLTAATDIPTGSFIDATQGIVRVTTALPSGGRVQTATLWGGAFVVHQSRRRGMTLFSLAGALGCPAPAARGRFSAAVVTRRRPRRNLWATDHNGQFSTRGNNSVATVRGTYWDTVDTCAGTLTVVKRGRVSVRDLRRHRTVLVTAGHRYLARS